MLDIAFPDITFPFKANVFELLIPIGSVYLINGLFALTAIMKSDVSIQDIWWGFLFVVPNIMILIMNKNWNFRTIMVFSLLCLWAARRGLYLQQRHKEGEDSRYGERKTVWSRMGNLIYALLFFFSIFFA